MRINDEIRNDELKMAMITLKLQNDQENENIFIDELRKAYFLIPALNDENKDELTFMLLCNQDNDIYFQGYTDEDEYNKWQEANNSKSFVLNFDEFANIIISSDDEVKGLVINPFTQNIVLSKDMIQNIFNKDKIAINFSITCPENIKRKLRKILEEVKEVNKAYIFNIKKNNIDGYMLIVDISVKKRKEIMAKIGDMVKERIDNINLDIVLATDEMAKDIIKNNKPIYFKK